MPHYYDNYDGPYYGDYPADYHSSYGTHRTTQSQRHYPYPSNQVAPLEYPSRPRRRYSHSQVFDSTAPDYNYPSYITQPHYSGQQQRTSLPSQRQQHRLPSSAQRQHSVPPSTEAKAVGDKSASRRGAYQSYPPDPTSLPLRQDPRMFQDQQHQYDSNTRQRRSSTGSTWDFASSSSSYQPDHVNPSGYDDYATDSQDYPVDGDSDDDDSLNSLEMLALENAKRNEKPPGRTPSPFDPDNLSIPLSAQIERGVNNNNQQQQRTDPHQHQHTANLINDPAPPVILSVGTLSDTLTDNTTSHQHQQQQQQQQQESTKKRRWPLSYLFRKSSTGSNFSKTSHNNIFMTTPSPSNSLTSSNSSDFSSHTNDSQNNNTRHIPSTLPTKQKQRQSQPSIVTYKNKLEATATASPRIDDQQQLGDAEMTALLDNIWCFKASQVAAQLISPDNNSNVWTGFDYKNQEILTNHSIALMNDKTQTDPGLELFDSHIRKGILPFLVVISQQLAYYPTSNNTIDKIEIQCLPNTKETVLLRKKKLG